jgi:hypothetical protein
MPRLMRALDQMHYSRKGPPVMSLMHLILHQSNLFSHATADASTQPLTRHISELEYRKLPAGSESQDCHVETFLPGWLLTDAQNGQSMRQMRAAQPGPRTVCPSSGTAKCSNQCCSCFSGCWPTCVRWRRGAAPSLPVVLAAHPRRRCSPPLPQAWRIPASSAARTWPMTATQKLGISVRIKSEPEDTRKALDLLLQQRRMQPSATPMHSLPPPRPSCVRTFTCR